MRFILNHAGMSLLTSLASLAIATVTIFIVIQVIVNGKQINAQMSKSDAASESLSRLMVNMYAADFSDLVAYCAEKRAFDTTRTGICLRNGRLLTRGSSSQRDIKFELEQPLDEYGPTTATRAMMCAELRSCNVLAGGALLEVTVNQHWQIPGKTDLFYSKASTLRKSRW